VLTTMLAYVRDTVHVKCAGLTGLVAPLDLGTESRGTLSWRSEPVTLRWVLST
jgi:hypothetical protein